jgi:hypothetical protein
VADPDQGGTKLYAALSCVIRHSELKQITATIVIEADDKHNVPSADGDFYINSGDSDDNEWQTVRLCDRCKGRLRIARGDVYFLQ